MNRRFGESVNKYLTSILSDDQIVGLKEAISDDKTIIIKGGKII